MWLDGRRPGDPADRTDEVVRRRHAVDALDLDIAAGEFFSMLGPSGSGKTTVLRLIAGFEQPTAGTIELFGQDVTGKRPRSTATSTRSSRTTRCSRT